MRRITQDWKHGKDVGILFFRLIFGLVLLYGHGFGKLSVIYSGEEIQFMDPIGLGANLSFYLVAFAEGVCAVLLVLGLFTRPAAFVLAINFLVVLIVHAGDGFDVLEPRLFYFLSYVALVITGGGVFSLDYFWFNRRPRV